MYEFLPALGTLAAVVDRLEEETVAVDSPDSRSIPACHTKWIPK